MKSLPIHTFRIAAMASWLAWLVACSSGTQFGGKKDSDDKKDTDDESEEVDEPEQIAGSFLCGYLEDGVATAQTTPIGCGLFDDEEQKLIDERLTYDLELRDESGESVEMQTEPAPKESKWLVHAQLPNAYKENGRIVLNGMLVPNGATGSSQTEGASVTASMSTADIGRSLDEQLGSPDLALKELIFHAVWDPGNPLGWTAQGIDTNEFCNGDGSIRSTLSAASIAAVEGLGISVKIVEKTQNAYPGMGVCFEPIDGLWGTAKGGTHYIQGAGGCLFTRANSKLFIASPLKSGNDRSLMSPENLDAFTKELSCK